jgi:dienelactone hydrolase
VAGLVEAGFVVLTMDWGSEEEVRYPAVLSLLPIAVDYLAHRKDVDPECIGVLGIGVGGDLAIRSAGTDQQIAAVLALTPFLTEANTRPGLGILKETSYLEALRWSSFRGRGKMVSELSPLDCIGKMGSRPWLLVYGDSDGITSCAKARATLSEEAAQDRLKSLSGRGHLSLADSRVAAGLAVRWFNSAFADGPDLVGLC